MKILTIDDDPAIRETLRSGFSEDGHEVIASPSGEDGLERARHSRFDLLIVDIGLPGISGLELVSRLRSQGDSTPVIFLTARGEESDIVKGLELGADGYVPKPFSFPELRARVRALMRRLEPSDQGKMRFSDLEIDRFDRRVARSGKEVRLTEVEMKILLALIEGQGKAVSRETLWEKVWDIQFDPGTATLDVHLSNLRKKLRAMGPPVIETVRRKGWKVVDPRS